MKRILCLTLLLAVIAAIPAVACNQQCVYRPLQDECVTRGYTTGVACHMSGPNCIEDQVDGCWAPAEMAIAPSATLAEISGGGSRCDCDTCCKDSYTLKCYTCGPRPPAAVTLAQIFVEPPAEKGGDATCR